MDIKRYSGRVCNVSRKDSILSQSLPGWGPFSNGTKEGITNHAEGIGAKPWKSGEVVSLLKACQRCCFLNRSRSRCCFVSRDCRKDLPLPSPPPPASTGYNTCEGMVKSGKVNLTLNVTLRAHISKRVGKQKDSSTCAYQTAGATDWVVPKHWSMSRSAPLALEPPTQS